eukprot:518205_1
MTPCNQQLVLIVFLILLQQSIALEYLQKYIAPNGKLNFIDAENRCMDIYATHLASIHNENDMHEAQKLCRLRSISNPDSCWIGLTDEHTENQYYWKDESAFDFGTDVSGAVPPWTVVNGTNQPDNDNGGQNCVELHKNNNFTWADTDCAAEQHFLCNMPSIFCPEKDNWDFFMQSPTQIKEFTNKCELQFVNIKDGNLQCGITTRKITAIGGDVILKNIVIEMSYEYEPILPVPPSDVVIGLAIKYYDNTDAYQFVKLTKQFFGQIWYHRLFLAKCTGICSVDDTVTPLIDINNIIHENNPNMLRLDIHTNMMSVFVNNILIDDYPVSFPSNGSVGIVGCNVNATVKSLYISDVNTFYKPLPPQPTMEPTTTTIISSVTGAPTTNTISAVTPVVTQKVNDGTVYVEIKLTYNVQNNMNLSHVQIIEIFVNATKSGLDALAANYDCINNYTIISVNNSANNVSLITAVLYTCEQINDEILIADNENKLETELVEKINNAVLIVPENSFKVEVDIISNKAIETSTTNIVLMTNSTLTKVVENNSIMNILYIIGLVILVLVMFLCCIIIYKVKKENKDKHKKETQNQTELTKHVVVNRNKKHAVFIDDDSVVEEDNTFAHPIHNEIHNNVINDNRYTYENDYKTAGNINIGRDEFVVSENHGQTEGNYNDDGNMTIGQDEFIVSNNTTYAKNVYM